ncbi:STAS domain-containing protein [Amycolatopsis magusensis]|uniref:STAS domain-containing protein n=1 Tax=Amycolatopsis magusensis TaxID=882444 RepID=UPI0024A84D7F|nr:STAS domain-containing protein [Amycolatopsis magusensis]MDI5979653.1 hypothetical protein [Amycolatopsis magusensis]
MTGDHDVLSVTYGERAGCAVVRVAGTLDVVGYPRLRDVMLKCAAEQPSAVIVVVERLQVATASLLSVFAQVSMRLSDWPAVPVLLVAADELARRLFEHAPVSRFVPVFRTVESAVRDAQRQPRRRRAKLTLPRLVDTAQQARNFTRRVCEYWLPDNEVAADAVVITNELVDNVLLHTQSEPSLRLELRRQVLSVAVGDQSSAPARIREAEDGLSGGFGLVVVAQLAKAWGSTPAMLGGKVVWAAMDCGPPVPMFQPFSPSS